MWAKGFAIELSSIRPEDERLVKFSDYLVDNYISEDATFPPYIWANSNSVCHTTNACESFHANFNKNFNTAHPNIYDFINVVKEFQTETYIKLQSINTQRIIKRATRNKQLRICKALENYKAGNLSMVDFIKITSYHFNPR